MSEQKSALFGMILCMLFWGFSFISIKISIAVYPPMTLGMFRFGIAVVFLFFIKLLSEKKSGVKEKLAKRDLPLLIGASITGVSFYFFLENNGVARVTVSEASIIVGAVPVVTMAAEAIFYRTGVKLRQWTGAFVSVVGVALVSITAITISGSASGYIFMGSAVLCWVMYCFITKKLSSLRSQLYIVFWQSFFGFLGFIPFALLERPFWGTPNASVIAHLMFLGICCSALGYWFNTRALEVLGVGVSSIFINFIPVVTVIAGFLVMGDRLSPLQWVGAFFVLGGVTLAMWTPVALKK